MAQARTIDDIRPVLPTRLCVLLKAGRPPISLEGSYKAKERKYPLFQPIN
jgi:hypothetical protein